MCILAMVFLTSHVTVTVSKTLTVSCVCGIRLAIEHGAQVAKAEIWSEAIGDESDSTALLIDFFVV